MAKERPADTARKAWRASAEQRIGVGRFEREGSRRTTGSVWTTWREDGTKAVEAEYKDNRVNGRLTAFDAAGKIQFEQTWKGGALQSHLSFVSGSRVKEWTKGGQLTLYGSSGKLQAEGPAVESGAVPGAEPKFGRAGRWTLYDENGVKESAGEYDLGGKHGKWEYWDASGTLLREEVWSYGKVMRTRSATTSGSAGGVDQP
jgi:antitoxin component YwqK of YwqJK toxin-antitoxin module